MYNMPKTQLAVKQFQNWGNATSIKFDDHKVRVNQRSGDDL